MIDRESDWHFGQTICIPLGSRISGSPKTSKHEEKSTVTVRADFHNQKPCKIEHLARNVEIFNFRFNDIKLPLTLRVYACGGARGAEIGSCRREAAAVRPAR
jgi:hypothetical protein